MRYRILEKIIPVVILFSAAAPLPVSGQYREYAVQGIVVDTDTRPLAGVEVVLLDKNTSRRYQVTTNKKGRFSVVGIPHAYYHVTISKKGYETRLLEWDLTAPQERIQKVEVETIILATEEQTARAARSKEAKARLDEATAKMRAGEVEAAMAILKQMITDDCEDANALYLLGVAYNRQKMSGDALAVLKRVTELSPDFAGAYHQLGLAAQQMGDDDGALDYYERALEKDPRFVESLYNSGLILFVRGKIDDALQRFLKALDERPGEPEFLEMAGRCYTNKGEFGKALELLEKARAGYKNHDKIAFLDDLIAKLKEQIKKAG